MKQTAACNRKQGQDRYLLNDLSNSWLPAPSFFLLALRTLSFRGSGVEGKVLPSV